MPRVISPLKDADAFHKALENWFLRVRRPLPWREDYEPYHVWISEIMLQQTQMERGVAYYPVSYTHLTLPTNSLV